MRLSGKIALVTGGGRGIGSGCAVELAREGADIILNDLAPSADSTATLEAIASVGRRAILVAGDVFASESAREVVRQAVAAWGRIDILVSNPAFSRRHPFLDLPHDVFERIIQGTLTSGFFISQLVARHMVERGEGGKMVFISSVHAEIPYVASAAYNAAKIGLNHLACTIAAELLPHRINVNVIEPGWIDTPGEHQTFGDAFIAEHGPQLPWGRIGTPADIGRAAAFLCSGDADYITGAVLKVDGGYTLKAAIGATTK